MQFAVVILLEKPRFQGIKIYFCLKNAKTKQKRGQPGLTLENIEKPLIHFASPRPRKPLNHLKMLSPSPNTIEVFGKPPPVPFRSLYLKPSTYSVKGGPPLEIINLVHCKGGSTPGLEWVLWQRNSKVY